MKKIIKAAAPLALLGAGCAFFYQRARQNNAPHDGNVVIIPGNDPAFDPTMYNVLLVKRVSDEHRLAVVKTIRLYTSGDLVAIKALTEHGGYICGLTPEQKELLQKELEALDVIVENK